MISEVAYKFQEITKFDLQKYFLDYADFMRNKFPYIHAYYGGETESIDASHMDALHSLIERSDNLIRLFSTFGAKLGNVGYWELQNYCQDLRDTLYKVEKLPKYLRTSKTSRGYKPYIQSEVNVGGYKDFKDISELVGDEEITEENLILNNDLEEEDYEIDELKQANIYVRNNSGVTVETILEPPIGNRIYGKDIDVKIEFADDDINVKKYEDNVKQKIEILLQLRTGDIPEFPTLGRSKTVGDNLTDFNYADLMRELQGIFLQDDLFADVSVDDISIKSGDVNVTLDILTKYTYSEKRSITV